MATYYDRYQKFRVDGQTRILPFIKLRRKSTDIQDVYRPGFDRMDILSQKWYGNPYHGWLIMAANPQFGGLEFDIGETEVIVIPYPLRASIQQYADAVNRYINLNGL